MSPYPSRSPSNLATKSQHAADRQRQRALKDDAVEWAQAYGDRYRAGRGADGYFLSRRSLKDAPDLSKQLAQAVGTTVVVNNGVILSVWRRSSPPRHWEPIP